MASQSELTRTRVRSAWLFLLPMLVVLAIVAGWPLLRTIWFGFTDAKLSNPGNYKLVGFSNYLANVDGRWIGLLANKVWWLSVWNTVWFSLVSVALETVLGTIVALVLNANFKGRAIVRAAVLIPWAIPTIVSAKMWLWMLNDQFGILNHILLSLHIISSPVAWTANSQTAMWAVIMVDVWKTTPFMALLILAALQMMPSDCYEAAKVDGIHPVKVFFKVTLPLIRPALMVAVVFRALDALRIFDLIYVLTSGSRDTISMSGFARLQLVDFAKTGLGSAAATLLFLVIGLITVLAMTVGKVRVSEDGTR
ncbi:MULTISPECIES: carbohydrate ABC transporter permease [Labrys]|uniref:carbohydrate ABC transporter permease n=1 Tax=Labrys TaxID=204476 RepID=UPI0008333EE9|nr:MULTISPECIES: sugar ABC transporter permease [unclassified Labrys (in: a-proteobacteria)]MDZ5454534.1 sugar ABC transporter permease [Labrys sp. ZIDIC5]OCC04647.1 ABC transporter permease [Labrys sp. WJW]